MVDLVRGLAIVQMVAYHFIYDLSYFGWLRIEMTQQPGWIAWRSAIVSQFLLVVGIGIAASQLQIAIGLEVVLIGISAYVIWSNRRRPQVPANP